MTNKEKVIDEIVYALDHVIDCHHCPAYKECHEKYVKDRCIDVLRKWISNKFEEVTDDK